MTLGLRLVLFLGVPAGVGLIMLAQPLARLLFERGQFTSDDTARMIATYATGVWAYCALPVLVRGFYALSDRMTPVGVGLVAVALNLALNLLLIWPLAEAGLAVATSISAAVQACLLALLFSRYKRRLNWPVLGATAARTALSTLLMAASCYATLHLVLPAEGLLNQLARVFVPLVAGVAVFFAVHRLLRGQELRILATGVDKEV